MTTNSTPRRAPTTVVHYEVTGTRRTDRWRLGHLVEVRHESPPFPTVQQAVRSARALCRLHGGTWDINERRSDRSHSETLARVVTDALGRMWTDVVTAPCAPTIL